MATTAVAVTNGQEVYGHGDRGYPLRGLRARGLRAADITGRGATAASMVEYTR